MIQECDLPILHNWAKVDFSHGSSVFGSVYNDDRFPNGKEVRTSAIIDIDRDAGVLTTRHTTYALGMELSK